MKRTIMFKTTLIKIYIQVSGVLLAQSVGIVDPSLVRDSLQIINKTSPERAIRYAREILSRCDPVEDKKLESQILNTLGEIYLDLNLPSLALSSFIDSKQKSNNKPNANNRSVTFTTNTEKGREVVQIRTFVTPDPLKEQQREARRQAMQANQ